jgi:hypothetical protein
MNSFFKIVKSFFVNLFTKTKKVVTFPQEEEQDLFIGV